MILNSALCWSPSPIEALQVKKTPTPVQFSLFCPETQCPAHAAEAVFVCLSDCGKRAQVWLGTGFVYVRCWFCTCGLSGREVCGKPSTEAAHFPCPSLRSCGAPALSSAQKTFACIPWLHCLQPPPPPPPLQLRLKKRDGEAGCKQI